MQKEMFYLCSFGLKFKYLYFALTIVGIKILLLLQLIQNPLMTGYFFNGSKILKKVFAQK